MSINSFNTNLLSKYNEVQQIRNIPLLLVTVFYYLHSSGRLSCRAAARMKSLAGPFSLTLFIFNFV